VLRAPPKIELLSPFVGTATTEESSAGLVARVSVVVVCPGPSLVIAGVLRLARAISRLRVFSRRTARLSAAVWPPKRTTVFEAARRHA
jgi:hypothetical protein